MSQRIFIDTNVILDFFLDRKPFSDATASILGLSAEKRIRAYVSPLTLSNCYYILRRLGSDQKVRSKLKLLSGIVGITIMKRKTSIDAIDSEFSDFEDAMQYYSAIDDELITAIITRNTKDYRKSEIAVMTPDVFLRTFLDIET